MYIRGEDEGGDKQNCQQEEQFFIHGIILLFEIDVIDSEGERDDDDQGEVNGSGCNHCKLLIWWVG